MHASSESVVDGPISHKDEFPQTVSTDCFHRLFHSVRPCALTHASQCVSRGADADGRGPRLRAAGWRVDTHIYISYVHTLDFFCVLTTRRPVLFSFASRGRAQHRSRGRVCYGELLVTFTADTVVRRGVNACVRTVCASLVGAGPALGPRTDDCCARIIETR